MRWAGVLRAWAGGGGILVKFLWSVGQESIQWAVSSGQIWPGIPPPRVRHELVTSDGFPWFRGHITPINAATRFAAGRGGGGSGPEISGHRAWAEICWREGCGPEARPGEAAACVSSAGVPSETARPRPAGGVRGAAALGVGEKLSGIWRTLGLPVAPVATIRNKDKIRASLQVSASRATARETQGRSLVMENSGY